MKHPCRLALSICFSLGCIIGCGVRTTPPSPPTSDACSGVVISGTMHDSLTGQPVAQGWAVLESGVQLVPTPVYNFSQTQKVASDIHGSFSLCAQTLAQPSAIVLVALDASGKAYPPFVAPVSGTSDMGTITMGGCYLICGFEGQQQTSSPATIQGTITTAPTSKTGSVMPQYTVNALDGSKNLWSLAMPALDPAQSNTFDTASVACAGNAAFCAAYTFAVPSQKPVQQVKGGYLLPAGAPTYSIYAVLDGPSSCTPPFGFTAFQQDGKSFLTGVPGAQLSAADIAFTGCR